MKRSIARVLTLRISLVLLTALIILFAGSFLIVQQVVYYKTISYSKAVLGFFSDIPIYFANQDNVPFDLEHSNLINQCGDYVCRWYGVDYAYMCIPDEKTNNVTLISFSRSTDINDQHPEINTGYTENYKFSKKELQVWNGEKEYGIFSLKNDMGHEICTITRVEDSFGNKIIAGVEMPYDKVYIQVMNFFLIIALIIIVVLLGVYFMVYYIIRKKISEPAQKLSNNMQQFITDGKRIDIYVDEKSSSEFSMIAEAYNKMTNDIDDYIDNINSLSRQKERQNTELEIAEKIQLGFLQKTDFTTPYCDMFSMMLPAKNVGGDLYDYVKLDNNRVLIVIADISGKGISAALLMAVTLTLIRQYAKMNLQPSEILKKTNDTLSEKNAAMLFSTAFLGIYNKTTGEFTYSNAGHNYPYIIGDKLKILDGAKGTVLGFFENEEYTQETVKLKVGDTIFMYTDGITEATDEGRNFYGTERLEENLIKYRNHPSENLIDFIFNSVKNFAGKAEQHDDITMLSLTVKNTMDMYLNAELGEFSKIKSKIFGLPISREEQLNLCIAAEECFVNICSYAFEGQDVKNEKIHFSLTVSDKIILQFEDGGKPFNPLEHVTNPKEYDIETQTGGLGNLIVVSSVDDVKYQYINQKNVLTFIKYFKEEQK